MLHTNVPRFCRRAVSRYWHYGIREERARRQRVAEVQTVIPSRSERKHKLGPSHSPQVPMTRYAVSVTWSAHGRDWKETYIDSFRVTVQNRKHQWSRS